MSLLRKQLEAAPDAVLEVDGEGRVTWANARLLALFGYAADELVGGPVERLLPEARGEAHRGHRQAFMGDPRARVMGTGLDLKGRHRDGREIRVDVSLSPLRTADGWRVLAVVREA